MASRLQELCNGGSLRELVMQQMNRYNKVGLRRSLLRQCPHCLAADDNGLMAPICETARRATGCRCAAEEGLVTGESKFRLASSDTAENFMFTCLTKV